VTVYVSMPLRGPGSASGRDAADGARLALADTHGKVGELAVRARYLDDTAGRAGSARWSGAVAATNARRAAEDSTAIAYIGDFDSGATRFSLPITNEARILQVSPASSAVDLVQPYLGAGDQVPVDVQPTGERTFGRVIPSDGAQGRAAAAWAKHLRAKSVAAVSDGSRFGDVLVESFRSAATGLPRSGNADLLFYGGTAAGVPAEVRGDFAPCRSQTLIASDALIGSSLLHRVSGEGSACPKLPTSRSGSVLLTAAAQATSELPSSGQRFLRAFDERYGRDPGPYAAYGYEAMAVVLDSIRRAGDSGDQRDSVVSAFFDTQDRHSILGTYSLDDVGDTTLNRLAGYTVIAGRPVFARALQAPPG
jgi:branched-chain amino acid transport system substrate-binding protein